MTEYDKLHSGDIYNPGDEDIFRDQLDCLEKQYDFNLTRPHELDKRAEMLKSMFAEVGEGTYIEPPLHSNWGGHHTHLGRQVYANFGLTLVDDTHIYIGDYTMMGPNVVIATAGHPILPELRGARQLQYNMPVHIGRNCWLGAGVIVMPGVKIGDNSVIGAGSVVTKDIPANAVAVGNPCRVVREIGEKDRKYYWRDREIDPALFEEYRKDVTNMKWTANWIKPAADMESRAPLFAKTFRVEKELTSAVLRMTCMGVYEAAVNGQPVTNTVLNPGWTAYTKRLQVQTFDVTELLCADNELTVLVGKGWYRSPLICSNDGTIQTELREKPAAITAELTLTYADGAQEVISTDESWTASESAVRFSELYDGEVYDATFVPAENPNAVLYDGPTERLIPHEGAPIREQERVHASRIFVTPKGETVIDFGQEITGFLEVQVDAKAGDVVDVSFAEVMDKEGNFYTENYRSAKCQYHYICRDGQQVYKTHLTFYGYRYIRVNEFPGEVTLDSFTGVVVHSEMKRTGHIATSSPMLNQLFSNIIWGQKSNFLDVPTDCPQRDERLGWLGDIQVFARAACMNFDAEQFLTKWLHDLAADQHEDGYVGAVIPDVWTHVNERGTASSAWGDAATIVPWEVYRAYGNIDMLRRQFPSMKKWVDYIGTITKKPDLWLGCWHFADWLGLDAPSGSYKGSSREDFIASAYYAYSTELVIKAGKALGEDVSAYEALHARIVAAFRKAFPEYLTQTECVLAARFHLAEDCQKAADLLADKVREAGVQLRTGFVGTPYILHVLSEYGHADLAWELLLRQEYPSWLYPITKGATTIWEHWDGIMPDGNFWSRDMNSFNHYAYGSVADWIYGVAAGIQVCEDKPGYEHVRIVPHTTDKLDWLEASIETRHGLVSSKWTKVGDAYRYDITVPVEAEIVLSGKVLTVPAGSYVFHC